MVSTYRRLKINFLAFESQTLKKKISHKMENKKLFFHSIAEKVMDYF